MHEFIESFVKLWHFILITWKKAIQKVHMLRRTRLAVQLRQKKRHHLEGGRDGVCGSGHNATAELHYWRMKHIAGIVCRLVVRLRFSDPSAFYLLWRVFFWVSLNVISCAVNMLSSLRRGEGEISITRTFVNLYENIRAHWMSFEVCEWDDWQLVYNRCMSPLLDTNNRCLAPVQKEANFKN